MKKRLPSNASFEDIASIVLPIFERHGVAKAGLFGSFARGEAGPKSDVDFVVDFGETKLSSSFLRYDIEFELEKSLGRKVDFGKYEDFRPAIWQEIKKDEILIMAKKMDFRPRLEDILECIERLAKYTDGISKDQFEEDFEKQDAVVRRIEIIGEAVKHIPFDVRKSCPEVSWKALAGMRDIANHQYKNLKNDLIWQAATVEIPPFKQPLENLLKSLS